jgi:hypothetical protein
MISEEQFLNMISPITARHNLNVFIYTERSKRITKSQIE